MADDKPSDTPTGDVARWHKQSGMADDATDQGIAVHVEPGQKLQSEKMVLRATAHRLAHDDPSYEVRTLARLAASYILACSLMAHGEIFLLVIKRHQQALNQV